MNLDMRNERGIGNKNDSQCLGSATVSTVVSVTKVRKIGRNQGLKGKIMSSILSFRERWMDMFKYAVGYTRLDTRRGQGWRYEFESSDYM